MPTIGRTKPLSGTAQGVVVELDPNQIKFGTRDQVSHILFRERALRGSRYDIGLGWVISGHELTEPGNHGDVASGRV